MDFTGKNILITGGGGVGVGAGVCEALSAARARLIINEIDKDEAQKAADRFSDAIGIAADVSDPLQVAEMFEEIEKRIGTVHGLVNNAGVGLSKRAHEASEHDFERLYNTDVRGVWQVSKAFANQLIKSDLPGNIVNISSVHAHSTISRYAIYSSAKSAVEGLTRGMSVELGPHNIRVNAVGPGYVHSEQNYDLISTWADDPQKWVEDYVKDQQTLLFKIQPVDIGYVVAFLLSDQSRAVTGQVIYVDNGTTSLLFNRFSTE